jgi:hypothetical protein
VLAQFRSLISRVGAVEDIVGAPAVITGKRSFELNGGRVGVKSGETIEGNRTWNNSVIQGLLDSMPYGELVLPSGPVHLGIREGVGNANRASITLAGLGVRGVGQPAAKNLTVSGSGIGTELIWGGNANGGAKHAVWVRGGAQGITLHRLTLMQGDLLNPDPAEQHHLINCLTNADGDIRGLIIDDCDFGVVKGDAVFACGSALDGVYGLVVSSRMNGFRYGGANPGYGYRSCIAIQRSVYDFLVDGCIMTGSDDALFDIEATGTGGNSNGKLMRCTFNAARVGGNGGVLCGNFYGNGDGADALEDFVAAYNTIRNGRWVGGKMRNCRFDHNTFWSDIDPRSEAIMRFSDRVERLSASDNIIEIREGCGAVAAITLTHEALAAGQHTSAHVNRNTCVIPHGVNMGIEINSISDISANDNRVLSYGRHPNTGVGISVTGTNGPVSGSVDDNKIRGNLGGGSLQYGVRIAASANRCGAVSAADNKGEGIASQLVRIEAPTGQGAYAAPPVVQGNVIAPSEAPLVVADMQFEAIASSDLCTTVTPLTFADITVTAAVGGLWTSATPHGLTTGDGPTFLETSGVAPGGSAVLTPYWIRVVSDTTFRIAIGRAQAVNNTTVNITDVGTGVHRLVDAPTTTRPLVNNLASGDGPLRTTNSGGALPGNLVAGTDYWWSASTATAGKFCTSRDNAIAGTSVNISSDGTGVQTLVDTPATTRIARGTALGLGAGVVVVVAGNHGDWATYRGAAADPNTIAMLTASTGVNVVPVGSMYTSTADASSWRKSAHGAAGWVAA